VTNKSMGVGEPVQGRMAAQGVVEGLGVLKSAGQLSKGGFIGQKVLNTPVRGGTPATGKSWLRGIILVGGKKKPWGPINGRPLGKEVRAAATVGNCLGKRHKPNDVFGNDCQKNPRWKKSPKAQMPDTPPSQKESGDWKQGVRSPPFSNNF